jgi:hypothetical protein
MWRVWRQQLRKWSRKLSDCQHCNNILCIYILIFLDCFYKSSKFLLLLLQKRHLKCQRKLIIIKFYSSTFQNLTYSTEYMLAFEFVSSCIIWNKEMHGHIDVCDIFFAVTSANTFILQNVSTVIMYGEWNSRNLERQWNRPPSVPLS